MAKRRKTGRKPRTAPVPASPARAREPAPAVSPPRPPGDGTGQQPARRPREVPAAAPARGAAAWLGAFSPHDAPAALALALLVVVSYFPALQGGFVWDDVIFAEEPVIHSPGGLRSIWFAPADIKNEGHYWPLVYSSFWLEHKLWGLRPAGYHAVNIFLHLLNCLLLWRLLLRLRVPGAVLIAAVFAVHPLHVESVAWIIERKDVLSALFYLGAVLVWVRFVEAPRAGSYLLAVVLFTAGLLSKSVVVTLPLALLLWHWWQRGGVRRLDLLRLAPLAVIGAVVTAADLAFYRGREVLELGYTLAERALIAGRALWFYAGKLLWPVELAVIYPRWEIEAASPAGWGYVAAAAGLALLLWLGRKRLGRGPLAGALYFALTLGPVLGFVDYGYMQFSFVADRFQYLAGIGVLAVLIGAAAHAVGKLPAGGPDAAGMRYASVMRYAAGLRYGAWGLAAAALLLLATLTWRQAGIYRDEVALFSHVVALNPEARDAHLNLGSALFEAERFDEGLAASRIAVEQRPDSAGALANVGRALVYFERFTEAEEHLRRAVVLDPRNTTAHQNLAEALRKQGRYAAAVESYRAVLAIDAGFALAYAGMGLALFEARRYAETLAALEQALALQPELAAPGTLPLFMGRAARELGRLDAAAGHFQRAVELDPGNVEPILDLATLRRGQQRDREADALLARARALRPGDPALLHTVAEALRTQGRLEEAIAGYRAVLELDPEYAPSHAALGIALYQTRRYAAGVETMAHALALDPALPVAGSLHLFMGRAWQELGDPAAAVAQYEQALRLEPRNSEALDHLAMARFGQRRYEEALALYRTLAEIDPDNALTHSNLGAALYHLGRPEQALPSIERALDLDPDLEIARTGLAEVRKLLRQRRQ